jgi:hypothetical protein
VKRVERDKRKKEMCEMKGETEKDINPKRDKRDRKRDEEREMKRER